MSLAAAPFTYTIAGMALPVTALWVDRDSKYAAEVAGIGEGGIVRPQTDITLACLILEVTFPHAECVGRDTPENCNRQQREFLR
jgi:hypothetical protein